MREWAEMNGEAKHMILLRAKVEFVDIKANITRQEGEIFEVDLPRFNELRKNGIPIEIIKAGYLGKKKKSGPKVIVFQRLLYHIGGIETWCQNMAKIFEDRDITFVFGEADDIQLIELAKYANAIIDDGNRTYQCDVFISTNYDGASAILDRVTARKKYQTIHSDFEALKKVRGWQNFELIIDGRYDKVITASETAQKGLKRAFGYDSVIIPNPLTKLDEKPMVFLSLTRAAAEKGIFRIIEMAKRFEGAGKPFIWLLCSTLDNADDPLIRPAIKSIPEIIEVQPQLYSKYLMWLADYVVQLSDTEAYCYSVHEALATGVPVIVTPFDQAKKVVDPGKNGYIIDFDLSNLDLDTIFNKIPKGFSYEEKVSSKWKEVLSGEL